MDFKAIAERILDEDLGGLNVYDRGDIEEMLQPSIEKALVEAWNARGVADTLAVDERFAKLAGWGATEPYRNHMREAIKAVDKPEHRETPAPLRPTVGDFMKLNVAPSGNVSSFPKLKRSGGKIDGGPS